MKSLILYELLVSKKPSVKQLPMKMKMDESQSANDEQTIRSEMELLKLLKVP